MIPKKQARRHSRQQTRREVLCAGAIVSIMLATAVIDGSIPLAIILVIIGAVCAVIGGAFGGEDDA